MLKTTLGQLLIDHALPHAMRNRGNILDKKGVASLFDDLARDHPEEYGAVAKRLTDVARDVAYGTGGFSFGLGHMRAVPEAEAIKRKAVNEVNAIRRDPGLDDDAKDAAVVRVLQGAIKPVEDAVFEASKAEKNPLAMQVMNVGRGNKASLKSLRAGDLLYNDHHDNPIPIPVTSPYSQGLRPVEYWAAGFGARKGVIETKFCLWERTPVLMADYSRKPIGEVEPGEYVMTLDADDRLVPTRVVARYDNGERDCYEFRFREGRSRSMIGVVATADHAIFAEWRDRAGNIERDMVPLSRCRIGRRSAVVHRGDGGADRPNEPRAGLLGLLLGDGGVTQASTVFYSADPVRTGRVQVEAIPNGLHVVPSSPDKPESIQFRLQEIVPSGGIGGGHKTPFRAWLQSLGILGLSASEKFIPAAAWTWDVHSCGRLAAWLMETDGCFTVATNQKRQAYPVVSFWVTSVQLARDFRRFLREKLGIYAGPVGLRPVKGDTYTFKRADGGDREGIRNHDLHGFLVASVGDVKRIASFWTATGVKSDAFQVAVAGHAPVYKETLPRRYCGSVARHYLPTCDLEVADPSHRFVLGNGLVVSNSTQNSGFLSKQMNQLSHRLVVTREEEPEHDPATRRGLPVDTADPDNDGAVLAHPVGTYGRGTVLDPSILADIKHQGVGRILVRSPMVGGPAGGGVYGQDVGVRERGAIAAPGEFVGIGASSALSEKMTQGMLSSKHSGGVAGAAAAPSGFAAINQLIQTPKTFPGGAAHAQLDGKVTAIDPAAQGGSYVHVSGTRHYVPHGHTPNVAVGDPVEAGDVLSDGMPNPAEIVAHKGIGEGRAHFVKNFGATYKASGMSYNRRNVELLARGLIDHVEVVDDIPGSAHVEGDVVPYQALEAAWTPRDGARHVATRQGLGKYLEQPVLHHTVGTKVRPSMLPGLEEFGVNNLLVHDEPPPFRPVMVRGMANLQHDPDWLVRHLGSNLQKSTLEAVHRGRVSDSAGSSYVPAVVDRHNFGRHGITEGFKAPKPPKPMSILEGL